MMAPVSRIPSQSMIFDRSQTASYVDCATHPLPQDFDKDALALYLAIMRPAPKWLNGMLFIRDRMVRPFGLKTVGGFGGSPPPLPLQAGDRLDIFTVKHSTPDELTLFIEDTHLDVFVSVIRADHGTGKAVHMATTVHTHNSLGKFYMLFVGPLHRILVKHMLTRAGGSGLLPL